MPKDQEVLTGEVTRFYSANGNRPAKLIVAGADETFELTIYPPNGAEQPWDRETPLPVLDNLPASPIGVIIQAIAEAKGEYNGVAQFKPSQITVLSNNVGSNPSPKAAPAQAPTGGLPVGVGPREIWNAEGQSRGNSRTVASAIVAAYVTTHQGDLPDAAWLTAAAGAVNTFSAALLADVPVPEESDDDADDFGSL